MLAAAGRRGLCGVGCPGQRGSRAPSPPGCARCRVLLCAAGCRRPGGWRGRRGELCAQAGRVVLSGGHRPCHSRRGDAHPPGQGLGVGRGLFARPGAASAAGCEEPVVLAPAPRQHGRAVTGANGGRRHGKEGRGIARKISAAAGRRRQPGGVEASLLRGGHTCAPAVVPFSRHAEE